jgi:hypothetical protein
MSHPYRSEHPQYASMKTLEQIALIALTMASAERVVAANTVQEIVQRSVQNADADWAAAPQYAFRERDVVTQHGRQTTKTFQVTMLEGSPYNKLIAVNDQQLPPAQTEQESQKYRQEMDRRRKETASERQKRIAKYQAERRQDHALMSEMMKAFDFTLRGQETVNGHRCFVLDAIPRASYQPTSRDTKVLLGMRGKMWIDVEQYQWVKVHAEVFRPVVFGLFIAHVQPGTEFTLEQTPVQNNIWLPSHFSTRVKATVLLFSKRSLDDETYSAYQRTGSETKAELGLKRELSTR